MNVVLYIISDMNESPSYSECPTCIDKSSSYDIDSADKYCTNCLRRMNKNAKRLGMNDTQCAKICLELLRRKRNMHRRPIMPSPVPQANIVNGVGGYINRHGDLFAISYLPV